MTAAEIRQLAAVADLLHLRAACSSRPTSTARVRRWRELRREQAQGEGQGFSPQEDICVRPAPLAEEPASIPSAARRNQPACRPASGERVSEIPA